MILPYSLTIVAGVYFILLFLYWLLVFWWSKISIGASKNISFSLLTILWFFQSMLFVATASSLAIEIFEKQALIVHANLDTFSNCSDITYKDILRLPLVAEGSMGLLCCVRVYFPGQCVLCLLREN